SLTVVYNPPSTAWANEPAGSTIMTDWGLDQDPPATPADQPIPNSPGWWIVHNNEVSGANATRVTDAGAPFSPSNIYQFTFPSGFIGGSAPATVYYPHPAQGEVYAGFWWKPSNPWQNHPSSNVNKLAFWYTDTQGSSADIQMYMEAPGQYYLHVVTEFPGNTIVLVPNGAQPTAVTLGTWHQVEWYMKYASPVGAGNGIVKWWLDGVLQGSYTNVSTPNDAGFRTFQLYPGWGGVGDTKTETDY